MDARAMTLLTSVGGSFRAHVVLARLESEGIDAQLRGAVDGAYGFTVGDMARVDVYVPTDQLDDARYVLLADEVDDSMAPPSEWWDAGTGRRPRSRWLWFVALVLLAVTVCGFLVSLTRHW
jgi:Putative prokaryotic signal transducing protein